MAGLASLTKIYGIIILFPMFVDIIKTGRYRALGWLTIPTGSLAAWMYYCYLTSGDWLASLSNQTYWVQQGFRFDIIEDQVLPSLLSGVKPVESFVPLFLVVMLFSYLIVQVWRIDLELWAYSIALLGALLLFGAIVSLPRFGSFIFPLWLTARVRSGLAVTATILVFFVFTLMLWISALQGVFVT
jgi:hypothetical protein